MDPLDENPFIVISGPPQKGKGARISTVRSHIKRRYFQQQQQQKQQKLNLNLKPRAAGGPQHDGFVPTRLSPLLGQYNGPDGAVGLILPPEMPHVLLSAHRPMLDAAFLASETTMRMQKCTCCLDSSLEVNCLNMRWAGNNSEVTYAQKC
jgi:hypothetical protein